MHIRCDNPELLLDSVAQAFGHGSDLARSVPVDLNLLHDAIARHAQGSATILLTKLGPDTFSA